MVGSYMSASAVGGKEKNGDINQVPYNLLMRSLLPRAVDEIPNYPNLTSVIHPLLLKSVKS